MIKGKTREELEEVLIEPILSLKRKRKSPQTIKENLLTKYNVMDGNVQSIINNPKKELPLLDWRVLFLFAQQVYLETREQSINPKNFYTDVEIRKARQYSGNLATEGDIKLPLTLDNVIKIDYNRYVTTIKVKQLAEMSALLLNYNFDIQREAKKRVVSGETVREAKLIMSNVLEMKEHLKKDTLEPTQIVINASAGTAYDGDETEYNNETMQLTINSGTVLDIVDGYHRCKASELAVNEKPDIEFEFALLLVNYTDDQAAKFQGQLAKATPIAKPRQKQLAESRASDKIVRKLSTQTELRNRISIGGKPSLKNKEIVSYDILSDTIDEQFDLERVIDIHNVGEYLKKFFTLIMEQNHDDFIENPLQSAKTSMIVDNNMFAGYIVLARRLYEEGKDSSEVLHLFEKIDFSKQNTLWRKIGVLNEKLKLDGTEKVRKGIKRYFNEVEL